MGATPLPEVVEVVAAFPSLALFEDEVQPMSFPPTGASAAVALIVLARPYLAPGPAEAGDLRPLREAVGLARTPEFRAARAAYHQWLRDFVEPLRRSGETLEELGLDLPSLQLAQEKLNDLVTDERKVVGAHMKRRRWRRIEWAMTVIGFGLSSAIALVNPFAGLGVASSVAGFAGWSAGIKAKTSEPERPLNGASMFLAAERHLDIAKRR
jgi:hypothetical protein